MMTAHAWNGEADVNLRSHVHCCVYICARVPFIRRISTGMRSPLYVRVYITVYLRVRERSRRTTEPVEQLKGSSTRCVCTWSLFFLASEDSPANPEARSSYVTRRRAAVLHFVHSLHYIRFNLRLLDA